MAPVAEQPIASSESTNTADAVTDSAASFADAAATFGSFSWTEWPAQMDLLNWTQSMHAGVATAIAIVGALYLATGSYLYKYLVTLNAIAIGIWGGVLVGNSVGQPMPAAIVGGLVAAALTWPMLKYAVAVVGGILGFTLGVTVWNASGYEPTYATAGGLIGMIFLGMMSLILFRTSVVLFMSIQGSVMLVFGLLGLAFKNGSIAGPLQTTLAEQHLILPITLLVPFVFGLLYQSSYIRAEKAKESSKKKG
ncbi:MAG: hypothetical protein AAGD32_12705 [Planctomycetota bacterium]